MEQQERIKDLARKYVNRTLTSEEADELFTWLGHTRGADQSDAVFREEWEKGRRDLVIDEVNWEKIRMLRQQRAQKKRGYMITLPRLKWIAAASFLAAVCFFWWNNSHQPQLIVYETGYGETLHILIDEGSRVILNANSRLTWNKKWHKGDQVRQVNLDGEAFFEVMQLENENAEDGSGIPFRVHTSDLVVHVLGTSFNVASRRGQTDVFLEQGAITVDLLHMGSTSDTRADRDVSYESVVMNPGEMVSFSANSGELRVGKKSESDSYTDWKEGMLTFSREKFGDVIHTLEDIYGKKFEVSDDALLERTVNLALPYKDWETVRQLIGMPLSVEFVEQGDSVIRIEKREGK